MKLSLPERVGVWIASKKQPKEHVILNQNNTYIFPTAYGFGFLLLLLIILLMAINYQNSLVYLVTFFLGAVFFVSILVCYLNMAGLEVFSVEQEGSFEDEAQFFKVGFKKEKSPVLGLKAGWDVGSMTNVSLPASDIKTQELLVEGLKRGKHSIPRVRIESTFPFGFIRAWSWVVLDSFSLVYPQAVYMPAQRDATGLERDGHHRSSVIDPSDLKEYQSGENMSRVVWKKFAATDNLYVRNSASNSVNSDWICWDDYEGYEKEKRLQFICHRVVDLYHQNVVYGLQLPYVKVLPSAGKQHYLECLRLLAEY